jgi:hypothetical protein
MPRGSRYLDHGREVDACPGAHLHTPQPRRYDAWHEWAERMAETHDQRRCATCGFWTIWELKAPHPS